MVCKDSRGGCRGQPSVKPGLLRCSVNSSCHARANGEDLKHAIGLSTFLCVLASGGTRRPACLMPTDAACLCHTTCWKLEGGVLSLQLRPEQVERKLTTDGRDFVM